MPVRSCSLLLLTAALSFAQSKTGVRILLGLTDRESTTWDGSVTARGGRITTVEPWRFDAQDALLTDNAWKCSTHPPRLFGGGQQQQLIGVVANGIMVWLDSDDASTELEV